MKYTFPHINHIDELRAALADRKEFIFADRDGYVVANYLVNLTDTFPSDDTRDESLNRAYRLRREARGIIFCAKTGKVLARRYHKFFNLGERSDCSTDRVDFTKPHIILEKLDGSMITPFITYDGVLRWGTKMGETEVAGLMSEFLHNNPQYSDFATDIIGSGMTPIFEFCSRKQKIVVDYPRDRLVLTAIRETESGNYIPYARMKTIASNYDIEVVGCLDGKVDNVFDFLDMVRTLRGVEGFVIRFEDGHMLKVKAAEYLQLHRAKELITFEKDLWAIILDEKLDDLLPLLESEDRDRLTEFASKLNNAILKKADDLKWEVTAWVVNNGDSQKKFAVEFVNAPDSKFLKQERSLLFSIKAGKDPVKTVRDYVRSQCNTNVNVDGVRELVGGLKWDRYAELEE